jgi:hypothetical protein
MTNLVISSQTRIIDHMYKISDPKDVVYYVEDLTVPADAAVDPLRPFQFWAEANDYARDILGLEVDQYRIIEWEVD